MTVGIMTAGKRCYDALVRTTVTIEPDVERLIQQAVRERGTTFKRVLNDAIRQGLSTATRKPVRPFKQQTLSLGSEQIFPWDKALSYASELEDIEIVRKLSLRK